MTFKTKSALTRHRKGCLNVRPYQCDICSKRFVRASNVKVHSVTHTGNRQHECETCGKKFTQSGVLSRHKLIHSDTKPFKCEICGKEFRQKIGLTHHKLSHTESRPYKCSQCDDAFKSRHAFARHVITHAENPQFQCSQCGERFLSGKSLQQHTESVGINDTYYCHRCCLVFSTKCIYVKHKRIHASTNICTSCGKVFSKKSKLIKHEKIHKGKSKSLTESDVNGCDLSHVETCFSTEVPYECLDPEGGKELRAKRGTKLGSKRGSKSKRGMKLRSGDKKIESGEDKLAGTNVPFGNALNGTDVELGICNNKINNCKGLPSNKRLRCNSGEISSVDSNLIDQCLGDWQGIDINQDLLGFDTQEGMTTPEKNSSHEETYKGGDHGMKTDLPVKVVDIEKDGEPFGNAPEPKKTYKEGRSDGMETDLPVKVVDIEKDGEPLGNAPERTNEPGKENVMCHRADVDDISCNLDVSKIDALVVESFKIMESIEQELEVDEQIPVDDKQKPEDIGQKPEKAGLLKSDHDYCKEIVETSESGQVQPSAVTG
eukprot:Seg2372.6 transcript_id=Seg2372.6/GoldUCD/mRNA.D3Y31 product="Zinc finger protein 2" protein_id=Seg2372.6/GoldUCD/D3Y31